MSILRALSAVLAAVAGSATVEVLAEQGAYPTRAAILSNASASVSTSEPVTPLSALDSASSTATQGPGDVRPLGHREPCGCGKQGCEHCGGRCFDRCGGSPKSLFRWSYGGEEEGGPAPLDEPLISDRPDFTEASTTVGRGVVQLEAGYTYFFDRAGEDLTIDQSYPETLLRVGMLAEWFEFRIAYNHGSNAARDSGFFDSATGAQDLYVGAKIALTLQQGILPEMAIVPQMFLPTGADDFTADRVCPGLNWLYGWEINDFLSCGGSTQVNKSVDDADDRSYTLFAQSFTIGYRLTDRWGAYTEYFGLFPTGATSVLPENYFDGGFTFSVTNNLQLDIRAGVGLNEAAYDYFLGSGFVIRL
ncbi:MAG: transporter [Pirellulales bacterium]|nr:transporter [Pirellulales bacterium]